MPLKGEKPKPGDLIEFERAYLAVRIHHWGVYVGNDYIVHLADVNGITTSNPFPSANGNTVVRKDRLQDVARNCNYCVNNKYDRRQKPYPVEEIIKRAIKRVGEKREYNIISQNCEHFVTEVRYNKAMSDQVTNAAEKVEEGVKIGIKAGLVILMAAGIIGLFSVMRL